MYQQLAWIVTIVVVSFLFLVFFSIVRKSNKREDYQPIIEKAYKIRKVWFIFLVIVMSIATVLSLSHLPYKGHEHKAQDGTITKYQVVEAKGYQFAWELSQEEFEVGVPYQFNVTSKDVNHGFGIYDEDLHLLAQVQAMPEYTNPLYFTFDKPGKYQILCLEYCSVGHHAMIKEIVVKSNGGEHHGK